ncbi:hypothetical protein AGR7C_pTi0126 [Agrobacterium deltaense Zutra 3/1]|uniref:Uncharacterized protein n=1 Tax=Agrobacterium deltaense Zutra 3/1 TaxID=1183427 RepID=A0A1S7S695_9HYPH|nr:hypothetical protein AGR7C_pTi0126 [Agrobacterium deltaense Zutra 3/1]
MLVIHQANPIGGIQKILALSHNATSDV